MIVLSEFHDSTDCCSYPCSLGVFHLSDVLGRVGEPLHRHRNATTRCIRSQVPGEFVCCRSSATGDRLRRLCLTQSGPLPRHQWHFSEVTASSWFQDWSAPQRVKTPGAPVRVTAQVVRVCGTTLPAGCDILQDGEVLQDVMACNKGRCCRL